MTERRDMPETALHIAATILQRDFSETFGMETIERLLNSCYDQLAARATVTTYLPLLAERFARQRLNAVARLEGWIRDGKPTVDRRPPRRAPGSGRPGSAGRPRKRKA